ncbi:MAG: hypothetical protein L6437_02950 [Kiritimatiellae bacterium]|nr:hypothetical protein [Kiritimatiellia bacterium]MCG2812744.1 hypothetical protein [Candidatus Aminicenantes bacterium]
MNTKLQKIAFSIEENPYESSGHIYHPLPFPEFQHLKTSSAVKSAYRKWDLIARSLRLSSFPFDHQVLDVGANAGFYSFCFAKRGAKVDAYEPHKYYAEIGRQIVDATGLHVQWQNKQLEPGDLVAKKYEITLMLSVFQWISQGDQHLQEATNLLRLTASSSRYLFFELGCNQGKSAISTRERPIAWVWRLLQQTTAPKSIAFLGTAVAWGKARRHLFVCTDGPVYLTPWQRLVTYLLRNRWIR